MSKYIRYVLAIKFVRKEIQSKNFKGIIFLQTHATVACEDILIKKYNDRYIVDIRDYTLENVSIYYKKECIVIKNSYATVISSPAYCNFLPKKHDYIIAHNYNKIEPNIIEEINSAKTIDAEQKTPITISCI